jgi:predicted acetyltransferase
MVALIPVDVDDQRLGRLLQLYIHEWSGLIAVSIREDALYVYEDLPLYRDRDARAAFLFVDADTATPLGFALASRDPTACWHVEEFFVIAGARRRGVGRQAAEVLFAARPGRWTLTVRPESPGALNFWRRMGRVVDERVEVGADGVTRTRLSYAA